MTDKIEIDDLVLEDVGAMELDGDFPAVAAAGTASTVGTASSAGSCASSLSTVGCFSN